VQINHYTVYIPYTYVGEFCTLRQSGHSSLFVQMVTY